MVIHACDPSTWEAKTRGWRVLGQPGLYNKTLSQKKKKVARLSKHSTTEPWT
jgi:hypothetical protein